MNTWQIAATRAVLTALVVGALGALAMWSQTESLKQVAIAGLTPALTVLALRLGAEGIYDVNALKRDAKSDQP